MVPQLDHCSAFGSRGTYRKEIRRRLMDGKVLSQYDIQASHRYGTRTRWLRLCSGEWDSVEWQQRFVVGADRVSVALHPGEVVPPQPELKAAEDCRTPDLRNSCG